MSTVGHGHGGYRHPFIVGTYFLGGVGDNPRTLTDLAMSQFSWSIRSRPHWWESYQDENIREQWAESAVGKDWIVSTPSSMAKVSLSEKQIQYVLDELSGYVFLRDDANHCQVSCFERIWESDSLLDHSTFSSFNEALVRLRKDKTLSTNTASALTVVDPMLHPLRYTQTLVSQPPFHSISLQPPPQLTDIYTLSQKYALLPSDVYVSPSGEAKFLSYINDINPQTHRSIYGFMQQALTSLIPLFEHTLTDLHRNNPLMQRIPGSCRYAVWDEPEPPEYSDDEEGWVNYEREMRHWSLNRPITLPDVPGAGYMGGLEERKFRVSLKGKRLQCIVRVEEHQTIPGGPSFQGTPWHVEGMRNERIVASGFIFTAVENVEDCNLQFRMAVSYPRGFTAGDTGATFRTWGLRDGDSCHAYIGSVAIREGLAIVFPNIYQYRFTPLTPSKPTSETGDPSEPSKFTVTSFLLVDPDLPVGTVISTRSVPPQQKGWMRQALVETLVLDSDVEDGDDGKGKDNELAQRRRRRQLPRLPVELIDKIVDMVDGLVDEDESRRCKEALTEERERFWKSNDNYHFCIPFDVWNGPEMIQ
ncbi:hypothetical protein GYMLUDRAFT_42178 [Collybiopsis luxurians FD-317 M1]|uniref:Uncharacterized protein n=1 Tax=Collybiopsis luxurians FD-317 M1 TaxID=944289 RepID=A0A0D0CSD6_9AGAR|nr:hypothetical protein GYMLUDRAFT_42178 [Collybiopsis luxurians FD-317 M1]